MEFLKTILGDELYGQISEKITNYNNDEKNEQKIKLGNLGTGDYVSKGKYDSLEQTIIGKNDEIKKANDLIAELKKGTKGNDELQAKISGYESQIANLQNEIKENKIKSAIKVALLSEKAVDVDYLTFKLENKFKDENRKFELDENDNLKDWKEISADLKVQFPNQFESGENSKKIDEHKLDTGESNKTLTKSDILKMPYSERIKLYTENEEKYNEAMQK